MPRYNFDEEQKQRIAILAQKGMSFNNIAKELGVYPQVIQTYCKKNGIKSLAAHFEWTQERVDFLIKAYEDGLSIDEITSKLDTTKHSVYSKAKALKLIKRFVSIEEEKFILEYYQKLTVSEIAKAINKNRKTVYDYIEKNALSAPLSRFNFYYKENEDFKKDFENPALSSSYVGKKYGFNDSYIGAKRKELIGDYKSMINTFLCKSVPELQFEDIMEEIDLTFFYEYKINKWKCDYYLGQKIIVEIQGEYWHSLDKVKEKDDRKFQELLDLGYTIITFNETSLENKNFVKEVVFKTIQKAVLGGNCETPKIINAELSGNDRNAGDSRQPEPKVCDNARSYISL